MRFVGLLVAVLVVYHEAAGDPELKRPDGADESARIVNGKPAVEGQFPYAVAIYYNGDYVCTGSIISNRFILTAAHCVVRRGSEQPHFMFFGIANVNQSSSHQLIEFSDIKVHPGYDEVHNDIAILTASTDIIFDENVHPICIASPNTPDNRYCNATVVGYGRTNKRNDDLPDLLQWAEQKIFPNVVCRSLHREIDENEMCAGAFDFSNLRLKGVCNGDSGGALLHLSASRPPVLIGVTAYINTFFGCGSPALFMRASKYYDFIMEATSDNVMCVV